MVSDLERSNTTMETPLQQQLVPANQRQLEPLAINNNSNSQLEEISGLGGGGPIRRRIKSLTIKLKPFDTSLTDEEAINVRNAIESLLQNYFFEVQPWAVKDKDESITSNTNNNNNDNRLHTSIHDASAHRESNLPPDGSVTYVGLAQILENKQTEDLQGVELTMNGLVYFAEGSSNMNVPNETELLQTMETQALGGNNSALVVDALKDFFPSQQQELVVTVETPLGAAQDIATDADATETTQPPISVVENIETATDPPLIAPVEENSDLGSNSEASAVTDAPKVETTIPPQPAWVDELLKPPKEGSSVVAQANSDLSPDASTKPLALGGGIGAALVALVIAMALFAVKRRRSSSSGNSSSNYGRKKREASESGDEILVGISSDDHDAEHGFGLDSSHPHEDWKEHSNTPKSADKTNLTLLASEPLPVVVPNGNDEGESSSSNPLSKATNTNTALSKFSSVFRRKNPVVEQHLDSMGSNDMNDNQHPQGGAAAAAGYHQQLDEEESSLSEGYNNNNNNILNMSNYEFTDDGLSDFDDVVSIQPHVVTLQSLESFEEQHTSMTHQEYIVQKDQLGSAFEEVPTTSILGPLEPTVANGATTAADNHLKVLLTNTPTGATAASGGDLSYSSSSISAHQPEPPQLLPQNSSGGATADPHELEDEREDQRRVYSMMPNPYVPRRMPPSAFARQKAAAVDKSAPCVLQATDFTASSLARSSNHSSLDNHSSSTHSKMIPKLAAPSWWSDEGNNHPNRSVNPQYKATRKRSSSPAVKSAFQEDDLAYSGDEENTFGVADSDGWDPADTELSSMGDAPTQEDLHMVEFHPGVVVGPPENSLATPAPTTTSNSRHQEPPGKSPVKPKTNQEPPGTAPYRVVSTKATSPSSNLEAAKSVLQKLKSSSDSNNNESYESCESGDSIEAAKSILQKLKSSSPERPRSGSGTSGGDHQLGESIATILDSDVSGDEEIKFHSDSMEI